MTPIKLKVLDKNLSIYRLDSGDTVPANVMRCDFFSICRTEEELSIVCPSDIDLKGVRNETGWKCIKVLGPLDFQLTGILAKLSKALADAGISIFAISTFDTDYILVKDNKLEDAVCTLEDAGYEF